MRWRTCGTCWVQGPCEVRDALRPKLVGLGLTSVKHRCPKKWERFPVGSVVLVRYPQWEYDEYDNQVDVGDERPAVVVGRAKAGGLLLWVYDNSGLKRSEDEATASEENYRHLYAAKMEWCSVTGDSKTLCERCRMPEDAHPNGLGDYWCPAVHDGALDY